MGMIEEQHPEYKVFAGADGVERLRRMTKIIPKPVPAMPFVRTGCTPRWARLQFDDSIGGSRGADNGH